MTGAVPFRLRHNATGTGIEWIFTHGARFTEPFFSETIARLVGEHAVNRRAARPCTPLDALLEVGGAGAPSAFIFHVSRCGSTLVAQMLAASPRNRVISEAPVLDELLRLPERDPRCRDEDCIAWFRGAVRAMGQVDAEEGSRLFIKLDCWNILALPLVRRAFPDVPLIFIFRHPLEVLVSLMRRPSMALVHDVVPLARLGLTHEARAELGREAYAAAVLGAFFRTATLHRASLVPVPYERLPHSGWESIPGCAFTAEERVLFERAAARDAKNPGQVFTADSLDKRREASPTLLEAIARWTEAPYQAWLAAL